MKPLPSYGAATHAARFLDGLFAWWWPRAPVRMAPAVEGEEHKAVHRWEDEGGSSR